ncbi:hypothetical protein [Streptomyces sp. SID13726]|uniref:hypothetical protein n=1 Tax=Streptomyces sp. SID13726 TaxID=2706058 RepID=UPI0013BE224A|nr:hypothetical protein [Streptomyces sp. SID13726]NEA98561.1 hypothetical protein [Streptomyces sp. SID13726]
MNLQEGRALPRDVFRGDSRPWQMIFRDGVTSRGTNYDLQQHLQGDRAHNSGYISTSESRQVSETFARSQGLANLEQAAMRPRCSTTREAVYKIIPAFGNWLLGTCNHGEVTAETFVYVIDPRWADDALYVPDQVRHHSALSRYGTQDEWAYVRHIPNYAIVGVHIYQMTAQEERGCINTRTITFRYDRLQDNRAHADALLRGGIRNPYNPATDGNAQWNDHTALLTGAANSWERGCTTINRCRGGGSGG